MLKYVRNGPDDVEVAGPDDLGLYEAALKVGVDHPGGLRRERAFVYGGGRGGGPHATPREGRRYLSADV